MLRLIIYHAVPDLWANKGVVEPALLKVYLAQATRQPIAPKAVQVIPILATTCAQLMA